MQAILTCPGQLRAPESARKLLTRIAVRAALASSINLRQAYRNMDHLTLFGLFAVTAMLVCYALENRNHWFVLAFAGSCTLASAYGCLQGAWPFGVVEAVWSLVAVRRWWLSRASFES